MAIRFNRSTGSARAGDASRATDDGFGQWWAAIAVVAVAVMAVLVLGGGTRSPAVRVTVPAVSADEILASLQTAEHALAEIENGFEALCNEPVLMALELEPDCQTGVLTLGDSLFEANVGSQLTTAAQEDVRAAVATYLQRLREMPLIWEGLEALEIRGHSDPRAFRNAYQTNLVGSQQRAIGVLLFLVGPKGVSASDREDLERLVTVSGASFSRPPESCPEDVRSCYPQWRRVEIRPVLSESLRRGDWSRTLEDVRVVARRASEKSEGASPRP